MHAPYQNNGQLCSGKPSLSNATLRLFYFAENMVNVIVEQRIVLKLQKNLVKPLLKLSFIKRRLLFITCASF